MRPASEIDRRHHASDPTVVGEQTCTFLRRRHPRATAENVAADLKAWRVKSATVSKMLERESTPSVPLFIAMFCVYGPEFLNAVLTSPPAWLDEAKRAQEAADLKAQFEELRIRMERL